MGVGVRKADNGELLYAAAREGNLGEVLKLRLSSGVGNYINVFTRAASEGRVDAVETLIAGMTASSKDLKGKIPLEDFNTILRFELRIGVVKGGEDLINERNSGGLTALECAMEAGQYTVVNALIKAGAKDDSKASDPLHRKNRGPGSNYVHVRNMMLRDATAAGDSERVRGLLAKGAVEGKPGGSILSFEVEPAPTVAKASSGASAAPVPTWLAWLGGKPLAPSAASGAKPTVADSESGGKPPRAR